VIWVAKYSKSKIFYLEIQIKIVFIVILDFLLQSGSCMFPQGTSWAELSVTVPSTMFLEWSPSHHVPAQPWREFEFAVVSGSLQ
jgi:hypothetical protein